MKSTKSLADITTRRLGIHEKQSPDCTGPKGCHSHKLSSGFSSTKDFAGGQASGQHPRRHLPKSNLVADGDGARSGHGT